MMSVRPGFAPKRLPTGWHGTRFVGRDFDLRSRGGAVWASVAYRPTCVPREHAGVTVRRTRTAAAFATMRITQKPNRHFAGGRSLMHVSTDTTLGETGQDDRRTRLARCLERARSGELAALDEVVRELNPLLWNVARAQNLSADQAADVVQTTWLELVRRLHEIRAPEALAAWLVTATRREAWRVRTWNRQHMSEGTEILESTPDPGPEPYERLMSDERDRVLWRHFQRLPERCRTLLRIVAQVERPDYSMVAEAMEMPRGSIGPTRGRCLAKLRELLLADTEWSLS
jgi:RNA polymerase sigma factor (sigma-70 family)